MISEERGSALNSSVERVKKEIYIIFVLPDIIDLYLKCT